MKLLYDESRKVRSLDKFDSKLEPSKVNTMVSIREYAALQEETKTGNIADLEKVSLDDIEIKSQSGTTSEGKEFSYDYVTVNEKNYRVPKTVLFQLKELMQEKPEMTHFKVKKTGEGLNTKYQVIDL